MLSSFLYVPANVIVQTPEWKLNFEVFAVLQDICVSREKRSFMHYVIEGSSQEN